MMMRKRMWQKDTDDDDESDDNVPGARGSSGDLHKMIRKCMRLNKKQRKEFSFGVSSSLFCLYQWEFFLSKLPCSSFILSIVGCIWRKSNTLTIEKKNKKKKYLLVY